MRGTSKLWGYAGYEFTWDLIQSSHPLQEGQPRALLCQCIVDQLAELELREQAQLVRILEEDFEQNRNGRTTSYRNIESSLTIMAANGNNKYRPEDFTKLYINGEYVNARSGKTYSLRNPKNNKEVVNAVPIANEEDVESAVAAAEAAYQGEWRKFTALQRTECLHRLAALMEDELISILSLDSLTVNVHTRSRL